MSVEDQLKIGRGNFFESYKLLIDGTLDDMSEMNTFTKMLEIFGFLSGFKFNDSLNPNKFSKLGNINYLTSNNLSRNVLDIIYKQVVKTGKTMDFYLFIDVIELIASKIDPEFDLKDKYPSVSRVVENIYQELSL
jgi:tubulin polyglutamylase TTLL11